MEAVNDVGVISSMGVVETEPDWCRLRSECEQIETLIPKGAAEKWAEAEGEIGLRKFVLLVCFSR